MKKLEVNTIKLFLREPVIEFNRPDGGRSIKTVSLLDEEEVNLTKDVIITRILPKLNYEEGHTVKKSNRTETFAEKLNRIISQREYLTEKEIASRAAMSIRYLRKLRNGENTNPTIKMIYRLADALECDAVELI